MQKADNFSFLSPEAAIKAARMHEGMQVADFHSASGFFAREAARVVGAGGRVWAVDDDRDRLARVKNLANLEGLENVEIVRGNIEKLEGTLLPEAGMDFVILANALCTAESPDGVIEEAWRVMKKSGRLLVVDWKDSFGGLGPHPSHIVTRDVAHKMLTRGGFIAAEDIPAGDYHWGMLMKKKV